MAKDVIDGFEVIDIEDDHACEFVSAESLVAHIEELPAIRNAGQRVRGCQALGLFEALDVPERHGEKSRESLQDFAIGFREPTDFGDDNSSENFPIALDRLPDFRVL